MVEMFNMDYRDYIKQFPNKYFDIIIADPPYFTGPEKRMYYGKKITTNGVKRVDYPTIETWDIPTSNDFVEMEDASKNQIIWGCNYFNHQFGHGRIVWDKVNADSSFSDCELAYCSFHDSVRLFRYMWNGMLQGKSLEEGHVMQGNKRLNEKRIHPTQKPVKLYEWTFKKYAKPNQIILDTHGGSFSSAIAAEKLGYNLVICEKNKNIFERGVRRFKKETAMPLFD